MKKFYCPHCGVEIEGLFDLEDKEQADAKFEDNKNYQNMVDEICQVESGLNNWEIGFIDNMVKWTGDYTNPQKKIIEKTWGKVVG